MAGRAKRRVRRKSGVSSKRRSAAQRAALKKAQLVSARKRRRQSIGRNAKAVAGVVGSVAAGAAVYGLQTHANSFVANPNKFVSNLRGGVSRAVAGTKISSKAGQVDRFSKWSKDKNGAYIFKG